MVHCPYMATIAFDTHKVITLLQERGFTKQQAEALITVAREADLSGLATKDDILAFREDIRTIKEDVRQLSATKLNAIDFYKFLFGAMAAQTALIVGLIQLLK